MARNPVTFQLSNHRCPEISQALSSLLDELQCSEEAKVMRTYPNQSRQKLVPKRPNNFSHRPATKVCPLCKQSGRQAFDHFLSTCTYLPDSESRFIAKARHIMSIVDSDNESEMTDDCPGEPVSPLETGTHPGSEPTIRRINIASSPYLDVFCGHQTVRITLDTGATGNMILEAAAIRLGATISRS